MARIKSKKYDGVYTNKLRNGDIDLSTLNQTNKFII